MWTDTTEINAKMEFLSKASDHMQTLSLPQLPNWERLFHLQKQNVYQYDEEFLFLKKTKQQKSQYNNSNNNSNRVLSPLESSISMDVHMENWDTYGQTNKTYHKKGNCLL